jgi:2-polyprenyl-3-methyl-5-hydroxy-6-metoxy-1,4-benzoquinol methylase
MDLDYSLHYREWHSEAPEHVAEQVAYQRERLGDLIGSVPRGRAIDLGSGMGFTVLALNELGFDAYGVERDPQQIEAALRLGAQTVASDDLAGALEGELAVITLLDVLEHLPLEDQPLVLNACKRHLMPGGKLVIAVPNGLSIVAPYQRYIDWTHTSAFTQPSLRFLLANAGFTTIEFVTDLFEQRRPPLRLWQKQSRAHFRRWAVRRAWRHVLKAELGHDQRIESASIEPNLTCVAS